MRRRLRSSKPLWGEAEERGAWSPSPCSAPGLAREPALVHCSGEQEGRIQPGDGCGAAAATVLGCRDGLRVVALS